MADAQPIAPVERPLFLQPYPGYWRTKEKLARIRRLQDLIRHREGWGGDIDLAQPLAVLLPDVPENARYPHIREEINKLLLMVHWDLNDMGVPTGIRYTDYNPATQKDEGRNYDAILDYFRLPRKLGREHGAFETVMGVLTQGVGLCEARLKQAKLEIFNPVVWAAYFIRLPITVMERAGFTGHEKTQELVLGGYARFMKIMMAVVISLAALLLGVRVPWKEIVTGIINGLFK